MPAERIYTFKEKLAINHVKSQKPRECYYCKQPLSISKITIEHKHPLSRGGKTVIENLAMCCEKCNLEKGDMTEKEYYIYKEKQKQLQENFELSKVIKDISNVFENTIKRSKEVKDEYESVCQEIEYLQEIILFDTFSASEGYCYAKKMKELLNKKNDLLFLKEEYEKLNPFFDQNSKAFNNLSNKISSHLVGKNKLLAKRQAAIMPLKLVKT